MGTAFITRRGGGGYAEGDTIPTANLQPIYSALDFTKTFVTNTYSPNTTTAWSNILDTFILSDGVTVLQITTTAFNLFKISEPLTLVATATHDSYSNYYYKSDNYQKIAVNEILGQFYVLYNGYIHSYSLTTLTEQWSTQYNSSNWSVSDNESICINPTDHTLWYIGEVGDNYKLIHYQPITGAATQTYTFTFTAGSVYHFDKSYIYDGVLYSGSWTRIDGMGYGCYSVDTGEKISESYTNSPTRNDTMKEWFLYQKYLYYVYYEDSRSEFRAYRQDMTSSSITDSNYIDVAGSGDATSEYYYHPVGITSNGNLFLVRDTLTKTMSFSGTSPATQVVSRSIGSVWSYGYRVPIKGPNYPVIGSEGFCYYPNTNDSAITQVTNLPTGYKVLSED